MADHHDRPLGFWMCTSLIVGNVVGMGIFLLPASLAPYGLNAFIGWGVTVAGCCCIAYVFARYAQALPDEDGPYGYTRRAFGGGVAFFVMWCYWVSTWITNATLAIGVTGYLTALLPPLGQAAQRLPVMAPVTALLLIWLFTIINLLGARMSGRVQMGSTLLKLLPMAAVILLGALVLFADPHAYAAHLPATPLSLEATAAAGTVSLFAMLGVECATIPSGKVARPETTIPRATIAGTLIAALVSIGVSAVPLLLLPQGAVAQSAAPFVDLFDRYWGADAGRWVALFVVVSGLGGLNGWTLVGGELTASIAANGIFPAWLQRQNRHGAAGNSLLLMAVLASAMVAMNYSRTLAEGFTFLSVVTTAANLPLYLVGALGLYKLWRRGLTGGESFWLRACAVAAAIYCVWALYGMGREASLWALALGAVSLPMFWLARLRHKRQAAQRATCAASSPSSAWPPG
ncbi:amino acid permease [Pseudoduganella ginsengisoli]|uniref:Arginine/agmatine antiporter n=1 Tax=Pseudoduganella ginsengisoli TaxID=1462440 RepID=A0A6L6Q492_9BURK|nr:amino acid permease [Pseudoduganella ginsengisoli]MTW04425.1 amino acid permease [Pseudoduganella ginsengisoli]